MTAHTRMEVTRDFVRSERYCSEGQRWYPNRQAPLDELVEADGLAAVDVQWAGMTDKGDRQRFIVPPPQCASGLHGSV